MHTAEIIVGEPQRQRGMVLLPLLRECVSEAGISAALHPCAGLILEDVFDVSPFDDASIESTLLS